MQATVQVKFVNQPREGKKMGTIKCEDGTIIGVWPNKLNLFQQGQTYTIEYEQNGDFKNFKRIIPGAPNTAPSNGKSEDLGQCGMFIMGVMGRCFQGTSQLPDERVLTDIVRHLRKAWTNGMKDLPSDPPGMKGGGPIDDEIPYAPDR
jgi:hypothetical protein